MPFVTQKPFAPGETYTYEFTASRSGSLMYHSHHNATDQVGRGLLGAFIVDPKNPTEVDIVDRDYVWISNDALGGFTINGHGFPAVVPVLAAVGEKVRVRFMNEGDHDAPVAQPRVQACGRRPRRLPARRRRLRRDTLGVNPGERCDVNIKADRPGVWAFHCHILPHVEGLDGMFGMVNDADRRPEEGACRCDRPGAPRVSRRRARSPSSSSSPRPSSPAAPPAPAAAPAAATPTIADAWIRPPTGPGRPAAGYLTIRNPGGVVDALIGASPARSRRRASSTRPRRTAPGMTGMHPIERLDIPAGGTVTLEPGGYHLMLMEVSDADRRQRRSSSSSSSSTPARSRSRREVAQG